MSSKAILLSPFHNWDGPMFRLALVVLVSCTLCLPGCGKLSFSRAKASSSQFGSLSYERKADAIRRTKELLVVYLSTRDSILLGENGIKTLADQLSEKTLLWVENWRALDSLVSGKSPYHGSDLIQKVKMSLHNQIELFAQIASSRTKIDRIAQHGLNQLAKAPRVAYPIPGYEDHYQALVQDVNDLGHVISLLKTEIHGHIDHLSGMGDRLGEIMRNKMVQTMSRESIAEVDEALEQVNDLFAAESMGREVESPVKAAFLTFTESLQTGRYFRLETDLKDLEDVASKAKVLVSVMPLNASHQAQSRRRIDILLAQASQHFLYSRSKEINPARIVAESAENRLRHAASTCANGRPSAGCSVYQWLGRLTQEQIVGMPLGELRALEKALDQMEWKIVR